MTSSGPTSSPSCSLDLKLFPSSNIATHAITCPSPYPCLRLEFTAACGGARVGGTASLEGKAKMGGAPSSYLSFFSGTRAWAAPMDLSEVLLS